MDFFVTPKTVTCLRSGDFEFSPTFTIGLGCLIDQNSKFTKFILVWFLDKKKFGLAYNYVLRTSDEEISDEDDYSSENRTGKMKASLVDAEVIFSLAILEGDYCLRDGKDPESEMSTQLDQDITFYLNPFAYNGFLVEDACRHQGVIQALDKELLIQVSD